MALVIIVVQSELWPEKHNWTFASLFLNYRNTHYMSINPEIHQ